MKITLSSSMMFNFLTAARTHAKWLTVWNNHLRRKSPYMVRYCLTSSQAGLNHWARFLSQVLPSNPEVADASDAGTLTVVASDETSLVCSTSHANPSATISWRNSSGKHRLVFIIHSGFNGANGTLCTSRQAYVEL